MFMVSNQPSCRPGGTASDFVVYSHLIRMLTRIIFRFCILFVVFGSQIYLYARIRRAILKTRLSRPFRRLALVAVALSILLLFVMNFFIAARPLHMAGVPEPVRSILFYLPPVWGFGSLFSAAFLLILTPFARLAGAGRPSLHTATPDSPHSDVDKDRRQFLQTGLAAIAAAPFVASGYGEFYASHAYEVEEVSLAFGRPLKAVQLSDIHAGTYMTPAQMNRYADRVTALRPDLFVITGDFVSNSIIFLPACVEAMASVRTTYGIFACLGNHENWYGRQDKIREEFSRRGIRLLVNENVIINTPKGPFAVSGIDDLKTGKPDLAGTLSGLTSDIPTLLLSHHPEVFPRAAELNVRLTLSGHWHGGQITIPFPGRALSLAHLMTPYPEGLFSRGSSHLYVSRGIGTTFMPIRLNASPEITIFTLT
jgi:uncharacterized protein